jgi:phosphoribosyl-ATP pyrophosphohydrolase/phosphoribosyl-AMP cyclohydrolase
MTDANIEFFKTLESVIEQRKSADSEESYTAQLIASGAQRIAQKVGEEGVELALAGAQGTKKEIISEAADLLYHVLVLLNYHELSLADVAGELEKRHR